jgi:hypothetical protein
MREKKTLEICFCQTKSLPVQQSHQGGNWAKQQLNVQHFSAVLVV